MDFNTQKAEQQFTGFLHAVNNGITDISGLVRSMGLKQEEWEVLKKESLWYDSLSEDMIQEIESELIGND